MMIYSDVLHNPHFNNLAAIIRVAFGKEWQKAHPQVPFLALERAFLNQVAPDAARINREEVINAFSNILVALTRADGLLSYTEEDLIWFVGVCDLSDSHIKAICNMMSAWWSAPDTMLTPAEVAGATGTAESGWRNKAAAGEIPGAIKKGKQWLLPLSVLRSRGVEINYEQ